MLNMLYAVSILYKYRLPFIVVLNKTDIIHHRFALEWMNDFLNYFKQLSNKNIHIRLIYADH